MNEEYITINGAKVELPNGVYTKHNASSILLAGHVLHSCEPAFEHKLHVSQKDKEIILTELNNAEECIFPAISVMGELISAADKDQLDDTSLNHAGYLISTLTELLEAVQRTKKLVLSRYSEVKEVADEL